MIFKILKLLMRAFYDLFSDPKMVLFNLQNFRSTIHRKSIIRFKYRNTIVLGDHVSVGAFTLLIVANDTSPDSYKDSQLTIGDRTYIGEGNNIRAAGGKIVIGKDCSISQHVTIVASNHNIQKTQLIKQQGWSKSNNFITIGDDVWIGAGSIILPGITIGTGAVIGAGSIVTKDIPEYAIAHGNPARVVKHRS